MSTLAEAGVTVIVVRVCTTEIVTVSVMERDPPSVIVTVNS